MINDYSDRETYDEERPPSLLGKPKGRTRQGSDMKPLILWGVGFVVVGVLLMILVPRFGKQTDSPSPESALSAQSIPAGETLQTGESKHGTDSSAAGSLEKRISALEQRLAVLETRKKGEPESDSRVNALNAQDSRLNEQIGKALTRLNSLELRMDEVARSAAVTRVERSAEKPQAKTKTVSRGTYDVKTGDTLYSIARENGITVAELRELNKMDDSAVLHPGDRIVVK